MQEHTGNVANCNLQEGCGGGPRHTLLRPLLPSFRPGLGEDAEFRGQEIEAGGIIGFKPFSGSRRPRG